MMSLPQLLFYASLIVLVLGLGCYLSDKEHRRLTLYLMAIGFFVALLKIWLFQLTPQWSDINPDSVVYNNNALAIQMHWNGQSVPASEYNLQGLEVRNQNGMHGPNWDPGDALSYLSVLGTYEWIYTYFVAFSFWYADADVEQVIYSNAIFIAFYPAAAFGLALALGARRKVALLAAGITILDPSSGVNAAWLLKDSLVGFLVLASIWTVSVLLVSRSWMLVVLLAILLSLTGGGRFVAYGALIIGICILVGVSLKNRANITAIMLSASLACGAIGFGVIYHSPLSFLTDNTSVGEMIMTAPIRAVQGGHSVYAADPGSLAVDETVISWRHRFDVDPVIATITVISRTLFAPYPWVAISPGLTFTSFTELYYPGMILWIMCLPGIFYAIWRGIRSNNQTFWLIAIFLGVILCAYVLFFGEWSTRQRVFALPLFFVLAAHGWAGLAENYRHYRILRMNRRSS